MLFTSKLGSLLLYILLGHVSCLPQGNNGIESSGHPDLPNAVDSGCLDELSPTETAEPHKRPQRISTQQFLQTEMYGTIEPIVTVHNIEPTQKYNEEDCFAKNEELHKEMMHRSERQRLKEIKNGKAGILFTNLRASGLGPLESFNMLFKG